MLSTDIRLGAEQIEKLKTKFAARSPAASSKSPHIILGEKISKPLVYVRFGLGVSSGALVDDLVRSSLVGGVSGPATTSTRLYCHFFGSHKDIGVVTFMILHIRSIGGLYLA